MSKSLSAAAQQQFDSEVKHAFQKGGGLRSTVTVRNNVVADIYKFRKMGKGMANQKATAADVTPMDVSHSLINCTLENWGAPEFTDIFDQAEVNFDERNELAQTIAMALGRRLDQLVIAALDAAGAYAGTVTTSVGAANSDLNTAKLRRASMYLNDKGVPSGDRHILVSAQGLDALLGETEPGSSDYNRVKPLVDGEINFFMGFTFHLVETRLEGGLTVAATVRDGFAYHKSAIGMAIGIDIRTEVNYDPNKTSWLSNGLMKAGACIRDTDGVVKVQSDEP